MLSNILADDLAREMGVLAHASKFVRVFINDRFYGVYQMQTRGDEEMLRHARRMPGPLFLGENLEASWKAEQFEHKGDQKFVKGLPVNPIQKLIDAISLADRHAQMKDLWTILDFDKYARFQAVVTLVDSGISTRFTIRVSTSIPAGLLEPLLLDANGHGMTTYPATWRRFTEPWEPHYTGPERPESPRNRCRDRRPAVPPCQKSTHLECIEGCRFGGKPTPGNEIVLLADRCRRAGGPPQGVDIPILRWLHALPIHQWGLRSRKTADFGMGGKQERFLEKGIVQVQSLSAVRAKR